MKSFKKTANAIFIKVLGALASFFTTFFVAKQVSADVAGVFFLCFSLLSILAVFCRFGLDHVVLRFSSTSKYGLNGILKKSLKIVFIFSVFVILSLCFFSDFVASSLYKSPDMRASLVMISPAIFFIASVTIVSLVLQGRGLILWSVVVLNIIPNVIFLLLFFLLDLQSHLHLVSAYLAGAGVSFIVSLLLLFTLKSVSDGESISVSKLIEHSFPLWIMAVMGQVVLWSGQLISSVFISLSDLALLVVCQKIAAVLSLVLVGFNLIAAPQFARAYEKNEVGELKDLVQFYTASMFIVAVPISILLIWFDDYLLSFLGAEYSRAGSSTLLLIFVLGQFINIISGSVGYLLTMTGYEKDMRNVSISAGVCAIFLSIVFTYFWGVLGAAAAISLSLAIKNILASFYVKKRLGFNPTSVDFFRAFKQ